MPLKEYFEENNETLVEFSLRSGVSVPSLYRYLRGEKVGRYQTALKISKATGGKVTIEDLT